MTFATPSRSVADAGAVRTGSVLLLVCMLLLRPLLLSGFAILSRWIISVTGIPFAREWTGLAGMIHVVAVDAITVAILALVVSREGSRLRALLGDFRRLDPLWGLLIGIALTVVLVLGSVLGNVLVFHGAPPAAAFDPAFRAPLWFGLWGTLVAPVTIAFAEELLYRGYLQPRWSARIGTWPALVLVALVFGLQHIPFTTSVDGAVVKVISTVLGGLVLGGLYLRSRRLWPLIIGHWLADVVGLGLPFLAASLAG